MYFVLTLNWYPCNYFTETLTIFFLTKIKRQTNLPLGLRVSGLSPSSGDLLPQHLIMFFTYFSLNYTIPWKKIEKLNIPRENKQLIKHKNNCTLNQ